jgi:hypothetical protein
MSIIQNDGIIFGELFAPSLLNVSAKDHNRKSKYRIADGSRESIKEVLEASIV